MARVIDAKYSTLIGTPKQLQVLLNALAGQRAAVVDMKWSNLVVLDKPIDPKQLREALESSPRRSK